MAHGRRAGPCCPLPEPPAALPRRRFGLPVCVPSRLQLFYVALVSVLVGLWNAMHDVSAMEHDGVAGGRTGWRHALAPPHQVQRLWLLWVIPEISLICGNVVDPRCLCGPPRPSGGPGRPGEGES